LRAGLVKNLEELKRYSWAGRAVLMGEIKRDWQDRGEKGHQERRYSGRSDIQEQGLPGFLGCYDISSEQGGEFRGSVFLKAVLVSCLTPPSFFCS